MDDIFAGDQQQSPEDDLASQAWMFGLEEVGYAPPPAAASDSAAKPYWPPPTEEDFDRVVREAMVDKLTERVHLKRRIDTVHNRGEPDETESFNVAVRALWAVPLVLITNGIQAVSRPLATCCSMTVRPPVDTQLPSGEPLQPVPSALDAGGAPGGWCEPRLPTAARAFCAAVRREEPLPVPAGAGQPAANEAATAAAATDAAASAVAASAEGAERAAEAEAPAVEPAAGQAQEPPSAGEGDSVAELPEAKKPAKKTRNDRASAISVGGGMTSGVGNLLGSYAKQGKKGGDRASAVGLSSGSTSAAGSLLGAAVQPAGSASGRSGAAAASEEPATPGSASKSESRKKKGGDGKTVVSNFQSNSATSNLLGGMMAQQKKKPSSKRADATASVIG